MIKKLDILIIKSFIGPFIATFFITLFVFVMQILWKYIDDLVGKGLDFLTLAQFLVYASATLVTLAMPISILLSSIMTLGKLGENFELVAIKSSGISLLRFMRPLFLITLVLSGVAFLFANNIAPVANLKFARIYHDIYEKSPAFDLRPGVFYNGFSGFSIKVSEKEKDSILRNVIIYEKANMQEDNAIISKNAKMVMSKDKNFLEFYLEDGHRYEEDANYDPKKSEFIDLGFKEYKKLFDLSQLNLQKTSDSLFMNNVGMKSMRQLTQDLDSLKKVPEKNYQSLQQNMKSYVLYSKFKDSTIRKTDTLIQKAVLAKKVKSFEDLIPDSVRETVRNLALNAVNNARNIAQFSAADQSTLSNDINQHRIEWNRKLSMSLACIVLFIIGAPLGSIIRRGGLGLPLVMALVFFMIYYLLSTFGTKFAKDQVMSPFMGLWLPVFILTPVGVFLTYKAMHDSQLFNREFYFRLGRRIKKMFAEKSLQKGI
ncbi:MAG: LptF/LptG family permease [Chitinophagaceae bacterium]|nr:LptF/LptG family permease [Chitinophagaceae bacterium]